MSERQSQDPCLPSFQRKQTASSSYTARGKERWGSAWFGDLIDFFSPPETYSVDVS